jgi:hypothetical protein
MNIYFKVAQVLYDLWKVWKGFNSDPEPEPNPEGSESFGWIRIRSGTETGSEKSLLKGALFSGRNKVVSFDYTYFTFTSSCTQ